MNSLNKFVNYLTEHYQVIEEQDFYKLTFQFGVDKAEAFDALLQAGWSEEVLQGGQKRLWHPNIKDRKSLINMSDYKPIDVKDDDSIPFKRPNEDN